jgi:hypothetical protein
MSPLKRSMAVSLRHAPGAQVLRALAIIGFGAGLIYLVQFAEFAPVMFPVFSGINSTTDSANNQRGDKVVASTVSSGRWQDPDKTVVRLRRAHHWFSTTLVETDSFGVQEDLKWTNNDALDATLGFGCLTRNFALARGAAVSTGSSAGRHRSHVELDRGR